MSQAAIDRFGEAFAGKAASHVVTAPGRVNLIGEHTDYNGYPVLPMALTRAIRVALAPRDDGRVVARSCAEGYAECSFEISREIPHSPPGDWGNYVKAAVQGLAGHFGDAAKLKGFDALFDGDVPEGAGLSSSSALVVASALALLAAGEVSMPGDELAELMSSAERYVGTAGGGMDQAVCLQAVRGCALKIDFFPLRTDPVPMPDGVAVVIANSLQRAEKSGAARLMYNRRPIECLLATKMIAADLLARTSINLSDSVLLAGVVDGWSDIDLNIRAKGLVEDTLTCSSYSSADVAKAIGTDVPTLERDLLTLQDGTVFPEPEEGFLVRQRVRHVLSEAIRVGRAAECLRGGDVATVGRLMNESHASCRDDYQISTPDLDTLVATMREAGALGARLTGAGFGGCAVALARSPDVEEFIAAVRRGYFERYLGLSDAPPPEFGGWDDVIFATTAGPGARVVRV